MFARFDKTTIITLSFLVAIIFFAYGDGRRSAIEQEEFNVMDDNPNFIVLRIYGDTIISASFDSQTHQLDGLVTIAKLSEDKVVGIRRTSLGRLKIKKKVTLNKTQPNSFKATKK